MSQKERERATSNTNEDLGFQWKSLDTERALEYEFRHGTPLGVSMYRYIERQVVSSAGMLMQCVQEGAGPVLCRMASMYAEHLRVTGDRLPQDIASALEGALSAQAERDAVVCERMGWSQ